MSKIPLTINHKKEDIPFFTMSESSLSKLLDIEFKKLCNEQLKVVNHWIKNKRCLCSRKKEIQEKKMSLRCGHISKNFKNNKIIQDADRKIKRMSSALSIRRLTKHKPFAKEVKKYMNKINGNFTISEDHEQ